MKRRDLIKSGIISGLAAAALCGCNQKSGLSDDNLDISPKQTDTFKFSTVLPYNFDIINQIAELNKKYKKSQIVTLYNNIPLPLGDFNQWLQIVRGSNAQIKSFEDFGMYAKYAMDKGFNIRYLFNSPKPYNSEDYKAFEDKSHQLMEYLAKIGVNEIKVGNTQTAQMVNDANLGFDLTASTAFEFHTISQYINLVENYPNIRLIDVAVDENHNFLFLKNLKKIFPKIDVELVLNDICIKGCPGKISHHGETSFCMYNCYKVKNSKPAVYAFKTGVVYPWFLEYYSAIGVNNFKLMPTQDPMTRGNYVNLKPMENYLECVENGVDAYPVKDFFSDMLYYGKKQLPERIKLSEIMPYLPAAEHFVKNGHKCASSCSSTCTYCDNLAEKFEQFLDSMQNA